MQENFLPLFGGGLLGGLLGGGSSGGGISSMFKYLMIMIIIVVFGIIIYKLIEAYKGDPMQRMMEMQMQSDMMASLND